jgi:hypothetical protein
MLSLSSLEYHLTPVIENEGINKFYIKRRHIFRSYLETFLSMDTSVQTAKFFINVMRGRFDYKLDVTKTIDLCQSIINIYSIDHFESILFIAYKEYAEWYIKLRHPKNPLREILQRQTIFAVANEIKKLSINEFKYEAIEEEPQVSFEETFVIDERWLLDDGWLFLIAPMQLNPVERRICYNALCNGDSIWETLLTTFEFTHEQLRLPHNITRIKKQLIGKLSKIKNQRSE